MEAIARASCWTAIAKSSCVVGVRLAESAVRVASCEARQRTGVRGEQTLRLLTSKATEGRSSSHSLGSEHLVCCRKVEEM